MTLQSLIGLLLGLALCAAVGGLLGALAAWQRRWRDVAQLLDALGLRGALDAEAIGWARRLRDLYEVVTQYDVLRLLDGTAGRGAEAAVALRLVLVRDEDPPREPGDVVAAFAALASRRTVGGSLPDALRRERLQRLADLQHINRRMPSLLVDPKDESLAAWVRGRLILLLADEEALGRAPEVMNPEDGGRACHA